MATADNIFEQAIALFQAGRLNEAESKFRKVLRHQPKNVGALNLLSVLLTQSKRYAEAEPFIKKAIEYNKNSDATFYNYGLILKALKRPQEALERFNQALSINAAVADTWNNRGTILNDLKRFDDAVVDFNKAIALRPNYSEAFYNKGKSLAELKRYDEAFYAFDKALALKPDLAGAWLGLGYVFNKLRRYNEAFDAYDKASTLNPDLAEAWLGLGDVSNELKRHDEAAAAYAKALALKLDPAEVWLDRGNVFYELKQYEEAIASYDKALTLKPNLENAWLGRGNVFFDLKRHDEAIAAYDKALALKPDLAEAWLGRGNVFYDLKRYDEAFASYDKALTLKPKLENAWLGRGNVFFDLKRHDEAIATYDKALALKPDLAEAWLGRGNVFYELRRYKEASDAYDKALTLKPSLENAWLGRGNVFLDLKRHNEAIAAYDKALTLKPNLANAWIGRGDVFFDVKRHDEALVAYDKALALKPDLAEAWVSRGNVFYELGRYEEAFAAYDKALILKPGSDTTEGMRLYAKSYLCDWTNYDIECSHFISSVRNGTATQPFTFRPIRSTSEDQLQCAKLWVQKKYAPSKESLWKGDIYQHDKIRIGYVSADLRQHPVAYLIASVFEYHDRSHFEITAISIGPNDKSEMRRRLEGSFDKFIDARAFSSDDIARKIREAEIDILIDLNGFTQNCRTEIFACRPAPIQVNYLGYPGTMGADYIDYIIGDPILIPVSHQNTYVEKVVYLPHSYLPHDNESRIISDKSFERREFGLPDNGFIFCCFNNAFKFNPHVFHIWMNLLKTVDHSVLWLSENNAAANNLKKEALIAGVSPDRLVFAKRLPSAADHLARHRLADLFLDTLPYNAHTTASDALWAGLPVLTQIGETFAGRVGASLLNAIGLPELITTTPEAYERMAIDFAAHPEKLAAIKRKLAENRLTTPLFDTKLFTKHIEAAYTAMYERHQAGLAPDHIVIPN